MFAVFLAASLGAVSDNGSSDYAAALDLWSACARGVEEQYVNKLATETEVDGALATACPAEETGYRTAMANFILTDGDPQARAPALAAQQTAVTRKFLVSRTAASIERSFLMQEKTLFAALDTCLAQNSMTASVGEEVACQVAQTKFDVANAKRLQAVGVDPSVARKILADFNRRLRQRHVNRIAILPES